MDDSLPYDEILYVVQSFYAKAIDDILIGYHFNDVKSHLDDHVRRVADFWQLQLVGAMNHPQSLPFKVLPVHKKRRIKKGELDRWILLFKQTLDENEDQLKPYGDIKNDWIKSIEQFRKVFVKKILVHS